jgi:hypothetical protein
MLTLEVVQAEFGDCFVVRHGTAKKPRAIVVDGGPMGTYPSHLAPVLQGLAREKATIDAVVLSHIDNDHVGGLLELFDDLRARAAAGAGGGGTPGAGAGGRGADGTGGDGGAGDGGALPPIAALWHNAFGLSVGGSDIAPRVRAALQDVQALAPDRHALVGQLGGVAEGDALRAAAEDLHIPINPGFADGHVLLDGNPALHVGSLTIDVVGPSRIILATLRQRWLRWLRANAKAAAARVAAIPPDQSVPNLSSIVLLVRSGGRSLLMTGDGRGDQIITGLRERGLLSAEGTFHVDVLKVPLHGSARNTTPAFYRTVTADTYVISANGRYGNPDLPCLLSIVDAAREAGRTIELVMTNETDAGRQLARRRPTASNPYKVRLLPVGSHAMAIEVGS